MELDLKERELNLREKELQIKEKGDSINNLINDKENFVAPKENSIAKIETDVNSKEIYKNNQQEDFNKILEDDFKNLNVSELPKIWAKRYDFLPNKYKSTIYTKNGSYNIQNNEKGVEDLIRGFSWSCSSNEKMSQLGELIAIDIGYNNPNLTYKSGMVFFYYRYEILNCLN